MFTKKNRATEEAWEHLTRAWAAAGDNAGKAGDRVTSVTHEARSRANAAADALAGRRPRRPWGLLLAFGLAGVVVGWAAASSARAALERQAENEEIELAETAVVVTPTYDDH